MKKILSGAASAFVIAVLMFAAALSASAEGKRGVEPGGNISWALSEDGMLTISGQGDTKEYHVDSFMDYYYFFDPNDYTFQGYDFEHPKDEKPGWYNYRDSVKSVIINEGVTSLRAGFLNGLTNADTVKIPASVNRIEPWTFELDGYPNIVVDTNNPNFKSVDGVLYSKDMKTLLRYPKHKNGEFKIPGSVENIGFSAFAGAEGLTKLTIPKTVKSIGWTCFYNAANLQKISFEGKLDTISQGMFLNCSALKSVTLPSNVKIIGKHTFYNCKKLENIKFRSTTTDIGDYAFYNCTALKSIDGAKSIRTIGGRAFENCGSLTNVDLSGKITGIGERAFYGCKKLTGVKVSEKLGLIGKEAFCGCKKLKEIQTVKTKKSKNNVTVGIGESAFANCSSLEKIDVLKRAEYIGGSAFKNCSKLKSVDFSKTEIGGIASEAFMNCTKLESIKLPKTAGGVGERAFMNCPKIKSIKLYNATGYVGERAFMNCTGLESFEMSSKDRKYDMFMERIGASAFEGCKKLKTVKLISGIDVIDKYAFAYCKSLNYISIPDTVVTIGKGAFSGCGKLKKISFPITLKSIGESAFKKTGIEKIALPSNIKEIPAKAFWGCKNLKSVSMPNSVTKIGEGAFSACSSLKSIGIPKSVTEIGKKAYGFDISAGKKISDCKIYGTKGTAAQSYAKANGIKFSKAAAKTPKIKFGETTLIYTGKSIRPTVTVKDSNGNKLKEGKDYIVAYSSKKVGTYTVTVGLIGKYTGTKSTTYKIIPRNVKVKKMTTDVDRLIVYCDGLGSDADGYVIRFKKPGEDRFKHAKYDASESDEYYNAKKHRMVLRPLEHGAKYKVSVCAYKCVLINGDTYYIYSHYTKTKTITIK